MASQLDQAADFSYASGSAVALDGFNVKGTMPLAGGMSAYSKLSMTNKMNIAMLLLESHSASNRSLMMDKLQVFLLKLFRIKTKPQVKYLGGKGT